AAAASFSTKTHEFSVAWRTAPGAVGWWSFSRSGATYANVTGAVDAPTHDNDSKRADRGRNRGRTGADGARRDQRFDPRRAERGQPFHRDAGRLEAPDDALGRAGPPSHARHDAGVA